MFSTRGHLQDVATRLFEQQGYETTTVEQIARVAGVSHMTFFRYFPTKAAVVLDDGFDTAIAAALAGAPPTLSPMARLRAGMLAALVDLDLADQDQVRRRVRIATGHPALRAGMHANTEATQVALVEVLVGDGAAAFSARVAAAAVLAGLTVALQEWCPSGDDEPMVDRLCAALDVLVARL